MAAIAPNAVITTVDLLGNALWLIAGNPGVQEALAADPAPIRNALDEALRLESPMQAQFYQAVSTSRLAGVELPAGAKIIVLLGSANRDAEVFPDPDRFDPRRANARSHLAFSYGTGACLGATLVRRVGESALRALLSGWPDMRLGPNPDFALAPNRYNRGFERLWIEFDRRRPAWTSSRCRPRPRPGPRANSPIRGFALCSIASTTIPGSWPSPRRRWVARSDWPLRKCETMHPEPASSAVSTSRRRCGAPGSVRRCSPRRKPLCWRAIIAAPRSSIRPGKR